jgi:hypothetical protein
MRCFFLLFVGLVVAFSCKSRTEALHLKLTQEDTPIDNGQKRERDISLCIERDFQFDQSGSATQGFDLSMQNALWLAALSAISYKDIGTIEGFVGKYLKGVKAKLISANAFAVDTQALWLEIPAQRFRPTANTVFVEGLGEIDLNEGRRLKDLEPMGVLVFRGTEGKITDWLTDVRFLPERLYGLQSDGRIDTNKDFGHVHRGFKQAFDAVWSNLAETVKNYTGPVWITGHSLGGALATLATIRIADHLPRLDIRGLYTFGGPRVGNGRFREAFESLKGDISVWRIINNNDLVAIIPSTPALPWVPLWRHVGNHVLWFAESSQPFSDEHAKERFTNTVWTRDLNRNLIRDHYMKHYIQKIELRTFGSYSRCPDDPGPTDIISY